MVIGTVFSVFLLLFLGYGSKKVGLLQEKDTGPLNTVVLYLTMPAFIFRAVYDPEEPLRLSMAMVPLIGFAIIVLVCAVAYAVGLALKLRRPTRGGLILAAGFGNTAFLGYPVVHAAFRDGSALVPAALYDEIAMALPLYTLGMVLAAGFAGEKVTGRQLFGAFASPAIWAIPAGLILRPFELPQPVMSTIGYLAGGTVPLAMLSLGLSLNPRSLRSMAVPTLATCALKLALLPAVTWYAAKMVGFSGVVHQVTTVQAAMPTAVMACVIASRFKADGSFVAGVVFASTLLSLVTLPLTLVILGVP